jgi:hypothetical protein
MTLDGPHWVGPEEKALRCTPWSSTLSRRGQTPDAHLRQSGPGYFGIDMGLAKRWTMPWSDKHTLQFRWEVFNITNSVRFDVQTGNEYLDVGNSFVNYSGLPTNPRLVQFALRYEF